MRYLYNKHFSELEGYCSYKCKKIINEHTQVHIWYYRGQYKGYSYVIKLVRTYKRKNVRQQQVPFYVIYNLLKKAKIEVDRKYHHEREFISGISDSLYDCMCYLNSLD